MKEEPKDIEYADLVEMYFLEKVMRRLPQDVDVLEALGDLYTRAGRYEDGLAVDKKLVQLEPGDETIWYNLGCSLALLSQHEAAIEALKHAVELGYTDHEWMLCDDDLRSLRDHVGFKTLIKHLAPPQPDKTHDS